MKGLEREEARNWLEAFTPLYQRSEAVIREISSLRTDSPPQNWDEAFSNENVSILMTTIEPINELANPKYKELGKLREDYTGLVKTCSYVRQLYLKSYYAGGLSRITLTKMVYWTTLAHNLLKDFLKRLQKVRHEIEVTT
jgi:hypothetical protein